MTVKRDGPEQSSALPDDLRRMMDDDGIGVRSGRILSVRLVDDAYFEGQV